MVDVTTMPGNSFGYVPTPAIVAPIEFTVSLSDYEALGGHMESIVPVQDAAKFSGLQNLIPIDTPIDE